MILRSALLALILPTCASATPQSDAAETIRQLSDTFEAARTAEMSVWVPTPSVILLDGCNMTVVGRSPSQGYIREIYQADLRNTTVVRAKLDTPPLNTDLPPMNFGGIGFLTPPEPTLYLVRNLSTDATLFQVLIAPRTLSPHKRPGWAYVSNVSDEATITQLTDALIAYKQDFCSVSS